MGNTQNSSKYQIIEQLGEGNYGRVYKAKNKQDKNFYAIKEIKLNKEDYISLLEIKKEAEILNEINDQYIVKYYDSFRDNNCFKIVMEYCDNSDLSKFIGDHKSRKEKLIEM
jgi:serine/threonine protein kinase